MLKMHSIRILALISVLMMLVSAGLCEIHTREDVRAAFAALDLNMDTSLYAEMPSVDGDYVAGRLTDAALNDALEYVNFLRYLAYLGSDVRLDPLYIMRAQHGAVLLAANGFLDHEAPRAEGMKDGFYQTALAGTSASNIAAINWMDNDILIVSAEYFVRDDGESNLSMLGHRRWLLNPYMGMTGFGLANSESGMSYTTMYVHDDSVDPGEWDNIKWPSEGAFPADLINYDIPWSVILNPDVYANDFSNVTVDMYEINAGRAPLKYFGISTDAYGAGPCIIFMPDIAQMSLSDYQQNQLWHVRIDGLRTVDGDNASIEYVVDMMSLYPIDPSTVEVDCRSAELSVGETVSLNAVVIPEWADDVSVTWHSTDASVAMVDENGIVTVVGIGNCGIIATAVNGRSDECSIVVK